MKALRFTAPSPPPDRGRLLTDVEVARLLQFTNPESHGTRRRVRRLVPNMMRVSERTYRWFELDVMEWLATKKAS